MKDKVTTCLRFSYRGKRYSVLVNSINYAEAIIVNKLRIGHARVWLILQNDVWRFISDMTLCRELKVLLVKKVAGTLGLTFTVDLTKIAEQTPVRAGFLFNAILNVLALKKELP